MKYLLTNENFFKNIFKKKETPKQKFIKDWEWMFSFDKYDNYGINSDILDGYYTTYDIDNRFSKTPYIRIQYVFEFEDDIETMIKTDEIMLKWELRQKFSRIDDYMTKYYYINILGDNLNKRETLLEFLELSKEYIRSFDEYQYMKDNGVEDFIDKISNVESGFMVIKTITIDQMKRAIEDVDKLKEKYDYLYTGKDMGLL